VSRQRLYQDEWTAGIFDHYAETLGDRDVSFWLAMARMSRGPVLELGCGTGRVLLPLMRDGHSVTGLDLSQHMLAVVRQKLMREPAPARARLVRGDMCRFSLQQRFGTIVVPFRSFELLLERSEQKACLECCAQHLTPGGRLVLAVNHAARLRSTPSGEPEELAVEYPGPDGMLVRERVKIRYDQAADTMKYYIEYVCTHPGGRLARYRRQQEMRLFSRFEMEWLLEACGLTIESVYGDYDCSPVKDASPELIFVARKSESSAARDGRSSGLAVPVPCHSSAPSDGSARGPCSPRQSPADGVGATLYHDPWFAEVFDDYARHALSDRDLAFWRAVSGETRGSVLELACGTGRVAIALARSGAHVVGLDQSEQMLAVARRRLACERPTVRRRVRLARGDMRDFSFDQRFGLIIVPFRSFQLLSDRVDQRRCLVCCGHHLLPGGRLVLALGHGRFPHRADGGEQSELRRQYPGPGGVLIREAAAIRRSPAKQSIVSLARYECADSNERTTIRRHAEELHYFFRSEAECMLEACGFLIEAVYGDFDMSPLSDASPEMIFVATPR